MKKTNHVKNGSTTRIGSMPALLAKAKGVAKHAYAPYSGFAVGAAVETTDGRIFTSANMENASFGLTICAEVGALTAAASAGCLKDVKRIVIAGGPLRPKISHKPLPTAPCGRCRQLIFEAAALGNRDIEVWFADLTSNQVKRSKISKLLPDAFGPKDLK